MKKFITMFSLLAASFTVCAEEHNPDPVEVKLLLEIKKTPKIGLPLLLKYNLKKLDIIYSQALKGITLMSWVCHFWNC